MPEPFKRMHSGYMTRYLDVRNALSAPNRLNPCPSPPNPPPLSSSRCPFTLPFTLPLSSSRCPFTLPFTLPLPSSSLPFQGAAPKLLGVTRDLRAIRKDGSVFPVSISLGRISQSGTAKDTFFIATMRYPSSPSPSPSLSARSSGGSTGSAASSARHDDPHRPQPMSGPGSPQIPAMPQQSPHPHVHFATPEAKVAPSDDDDTLSEENLMQYVSEVIANREVRAVEQRTPAAWAFKPRL